MILNRKKNQYSFRLALPANTAYFLNASRYQFIVFHSDANGWVCACCDHGLQPVFRTICFIRSSSSSASLRSLLAMKSYSLIVSAQSMSVARPRIRSGYDFVCSIANSNVLSTSIGDRNKKHPDRLVTERAVLPGCNKQPHDLHQQAILTIAYIPL